MPDPAYGFPAYGPVGYYGWGEYASMAARDNDPADAGGSTVSFN